MWLGSIETLLVGLTSRRAVNRKVVGRAHEDEGRLLPFELLIESLSDDGAQRYPAALGQLTQPSQNVLGGDG